MVFVFDPAIRNHDCLSLDLPGRQRAEHDLGDFESDRGHEKFPTEHLEVDGSPERGCGMSPKGN